MRRKQETKAINSKIEVANIIFWFIKLTSVLKYIFIRNSSAEEKYDEKR